MPPDRLDQVGLPGWSERSSVDPSRRRSVALQSERRRSAANWGPPGGVGQMGRTVMLCVASASVVAAFAPAVASTAHTLASASGKTEQISPVLGQLQRQVRAINGAIALQGDTITTLRTTVKGLRV